MSLYIVKVRVRFTRTGACAARAGRGRKARVATSIKSPRIAAKRAAAKAFGLSAGNVQTWEDVQLETDGSEVGTGKTVLFFLATLPPLPKGGAL